MTFTKAEDDVRPILEYSEAARCDDMVLYADYVYSKLKNAGYDFLNNKNWLAHIFSDRRIRITYGIAPYGTISRVRRKLQEIEEELKPSEDYLQERKRAEQEYKAYARKGALK